MTKHTFDYDHLCDLLYTINPADFKKELNREIELARTEVAIAIETPCTRTAKTP